MTHTLAKTSKQSLAKYDPKRGMQRIAVAEVAEKHYAKAKDATQLCAAIRAKLEAQAEFVFWWDHHADKLTGRPMKKSVSDRKRFTAGSNGLPDRLTIHRWRQKLGVPEHFEKAYEEACARYQTWLEFVTAGAHVGQATGEVEWYTPPEYLTAARDVLGAIDLDPASTPTANTEVQASQIFTADDEALTERWDGTVWMNPPYAQPLIAQFCDKLADSVRAGTVTQAIALVNNATETQWFRALADVATVICFPSGRVKFWSPDKQTAALLQGQAVLYMGQRLAAFCTAFAPFGFLVTVRR